MKTFKFKKIDAFASDHSSGNPAGMVLLDSFNDITANEMQQIAGELKGFVSEVGFVCQTGDARFELKYYSSEREVDFCGHATIAIMYELIKSDERLRSQKELGIQTPKGLLTVINKIKIENAVFISAPAPVFSKTPAKAQAVCHALKIKKSDLHPNYPISIINAGLETLIVPIKTLTAVLSLSPDFDALRQFCMRHRIDIITVFADQTSSSENSHRSRVFAPTFGYLEDPATGSGNAALGYYLLKNHLWTGDTTTIEQNGLLANPNIIKLAAQDLHERDPKVMFGGSAITRIAGEYRLT